jgi:hypothetical protein
MFYCGRNAPHATEKAFLRGSFGHCGKIHCCFKKLAQPPDLLQHCPD